MTDTPATATTPAPAPQPAPAAPPAPPRTTTGVDLVPLKGPRPVLDPGDASPLGHPDDGEPAPVPFGAVDELHVEVGGDGSGRA